MSPVVPYNPLPQVSPQPIPRLRREPTLAPNAPTTAFGGGIASQAGGLGNLEGAQQGFERMGAEQDRIALEERDKANQVAVTDAQAKTTDYTTQRMYTPSADGGGAWVTRTGKNAFGVPEEAAGEYWKVTDIIKDGLSNPDQQAAYERFRQQHWNSVNEGIQRNVAVQRKNYDIDTTQAALDSQHTAAVQGYTDPLTTEPAVEATKAIIDASGKRNGLPDEFIKEQQDQHVSGLRLDIIKQFIDNPNNPGQPMDQTAQAYFEAHKHELQPKDLLAAETALNHGSVEGEAYRQADIITGVRPAPEGSPLKSVTNEADAEAELAKIDDPRVREKASQQVSLHFNRVQAGIRQSQEDAYLKGHAIMVQSGGDLSKVPSSMAIAMGAHYGTLMGESKRIQTAEDPGDTEQVANLRNEAYFSPETFAARDLTQEKGLSPKQLQSLQGLQRTVGLRQNREEEQPIQHEITQALQDQRKYRDLVNKAVADNDENGRRQFTDLWLQAQENEAIARRDLQEHRAQRSTSQAGTPAFAPAPTTAPTPSSAPVAPGRSATNPVGLEKLTPPTPQQVQDIERKGPGYVDYLRHFGVDVDAAFTIIKRQQAEAAAAEAAKNAPKPKNKVSIERDTAGRATSLTRHPE